MTNFAVRLYTLSHTEKKNPGNNINSKNTLLSILCGSFQSILQTFMYISIHNIFKKYLFIWPHRVLVVTHRIFELHCGKQGLLLMAGKLLAVACEI